MKAKKRSYLLILILVVLAIVFLFSVNKSFGMFKDVSETLPAKIINSSSGVSWTDLNNDGNLDLFIADGNIVKLLNGDGMGGFKEASIQAVSSQDTSKKLWAGIFADVDSNGCQDLFLTSNSSNLLFINDCEGNFISKADFTDSNESYVSRGAAWGDYNNDGHLDLYVANFGIALPDKLEYFFQPNILYQNNGDGTFIDVTKASGATGISDCTNISKNNEPWINTANTIIKESFQPTWFDYNNDNLLDLFVTTDSGVSVLYHNNGDGTFIDVTERVGLCKAGTGMGVTVGDYDNDGDLDLFVTNTGSDYLWRNNDGKTFTEVAKEAGVQDELTLGWGASFLDYDNDGDLDLYVVNGGIKGEVSWNQEISKSKKDKLYNNNGEGKFVDVSQKEGIFGDYRKESAAFGDYNNDGFVDVLVMSSYLEDQSSIKLYQNKGNSNNWLSIQLMGTYSNMDAVGARITIKSGDVTQIREVSAGSSYLSQNSLVQNFGVGNSKTIDSLEIRWPRGSIQGFYGIKANQKLVIVEKR